VEVRTENTKKSPVAVKIVDDEEALRGRRGHRQGHQAHGVEGRPVEGADDMISYDGAKKPRGSAQVNVQGDFDQPSSWKVTLVKSGHVIVLRNHMDYEVDNKRDIRLRLDPDKLWEELKDKVLA
jgi:hypothetical protein